MKTLPKPSRGQVLALALLGAAVTAPAHAAFLHDRAGALVHSGSGTCVHTGEWNAAMGECPTPATAAAPVPTVTTMPVTFTFALNDDAFFKFDSARLGEIGRARLYPLVVSARNADTLVHIDVIGHADPIGSPGYNQRLGMRRAEAVRAYLTGEGIPADRIQIASAGSALPEVSCSTHMSRSERIRCLAPDRRVDVVAVVQDQGEVAVVNAAPAHA